MKRVYAVFETRYEGDGPYLDEYSPLRWYEDKFIDVYDNFPAAIESIRVWAEDQENAISRKTDRTTEELILLDKTSPYNNETKILVKRVVRSTLLKSS